MVRQHRLGDLVPIRRIQGSICRPTNGVSLTGRVLDLEGWTTLCGVKAREGIDIGVVRVCIIDVEIAGVDQIHPIPRVQIGQRSDARANPASGKSMSSILDCTVVGIIYHEFIFVSVAEENVGNHMWRVPVNDLIEEIYPITVSGTRSFTLVILPVGFCNGLLPSHPDRT